MRFCALLIVIICLLLGHASQLQAQFPTTPPAPDSLLADSNRIDIININTFKEQTRPEGIYRQLIGDVHLRQQKMHLWCDTGYIFPNKQIEAFGNVQMLQDDSIRIFSDSLYYDGITRYARLRQNVVLEDSSMTMFTDKLNYDLVTRIATFPEGSLIESDTTTMVSKSGRYEVNSNMAYFKDSVRITNPNYKLTADSLAFNTDTETAFFIGPTKVYNEQKMVYCEDGYYDSKQNYAVLYKNARFENNEDGKTEIGEGDTIIYEGSTDRYYLIGNAHFVNEEQEVFADTIMMDGKTERYVFKGDPKFMGRDSSQRQSIQADNSDYDAASKTMYFQGNVVLEQNNQFIETDSLVYNSESKDGVAIGNVFWRDSSGNMSITCGKAFYNDSTQFLLAQDRPLLQTLIDKDTLWLHADTLLAVPDSMGSDNKNLQAYYHVKVYKSDMQAQCDSLTYISVDSTFHFYKNPILWADDAQFTGDTIRIQLRNQKINQVRLHQNSFIVNTNEGRYFNQVKGDDVTTNFKDNAIHRMYVYKNGKTVYYAQDDKNAYMGVNEVTCEDMVLYFGDSKIQRIRFEGKPNAVLYPPQQADHNKLRLSGFQWLDSVKFESKAAFFDYVERPLLTDKDLLLGPFPISAPNDSLEPDSSILKVLPNKPTSRNEEVPDKLPNSEPPTSKAIRARQE